jgi:hypothetical protein
MHVRECVHLCLFLLRGYRAHRNQVKRLHVNLLAIKPVQEPKISCESFAMSPDRYVLQGFRKVKIETRAHYCLLFNQPNTSKRR